MKITAEMVLEFDLASDGPMAPTGSNMDSVADALTRYLKQLRRALLIFR
jgi:hypothetical protein